MVDKIGSIELSYKTWSLHKLLILRKLQTLQELPSDTPTNFLPLNTDGDKLQAPSY